MRKFFAAMENEEVVENVNEIDEVAASISLEEEQLMLDEAATDHADVAQDLAEAERIIEVSDALEDLAVVADGIEAATPAETALIEVAGNMAVAGTDVAPEEIVPAMESFVGKRIAVEGLRETANQIWQSIQRFLAKIWEKIASFYHRIFATVPALRKRVKVLKERAKKAADEKLVIESKTVTVRAGLLNLSVDGKVVTNVQGITDGLKSLDEAVSYVFGSYVNAVTKRGEIITKALNGFDPKDGAAAAEALRKELGNENFGTVPGAKAAAANMFPGFETKVGEPLMGGVSLAQKHFKDSEEGGDLGALDRIRRSGVVLVDSSAKSKEIKVAEVQISTLTTSQIIDACDALDGFLVKLEEFQKSKKKAIEKVKAEVEAASKKASGKFDEAKKSDEASQKASLPFYRSMLNFNAAYASWTQSPAMPLIALSMTTARAVMNVADKSLSAHAAPKAD